MSSAMKRPPARAGAARACASPGTYGTADHRQVAESSDRHLEKQNDELVNTLAAQVSTLKSVRHGCYRRAIDNVLLQLTIEIGDNVRDHNRLLGDMVCRGGIQK